MCLWVSTPTGARLNLYECIHPGEHQRIVKVRLLEVFKQTGNLFSKTQSEPAHGSIWKVALFSKNLSPACS